MHEEIIDSNTIYSPITILNTLFLVKWLSKSLGNIPNFSNSFLNLFITLKNSTMCHLY